MLEIRNIHKSFGDVRVLNGFNLNFTNSSLNTLSGSNVFLKSIKDECESLEKRIGRYYEPIR